MPLIKISREEAIDEIWKRIKQTHESLSLGAELLKKTSLELKISQIWLPNSPREIAERIQDIFAQEKFKQICSRCKGDRCCWQVFPPPPLELDQLFYWVVTDSNFCLPRPEWGYLEQRLNKRDVRQLVKKSGEEPCFFYPCIFLGSKGCRLKYRPWKCLIAVCSEINQVITKDEAKCIAQIAQAKEDLRKWVEEISQENLSRFRDDKIIFAVLSSLELSYRIPSMISSVVQAMKE